MDVLILGAGAVGGYLGGRLIEAGIPARFLLRERRAKQIRDRGLHISSPLGDWNGQPQIVTSQEIDNPADLVFLSCKAYHLDVALKSLSPAIGSRTIIIPLLNGLAHLDLIRDRFPSADLWGGVAHIGTAIDGDGVIRHLNDINRFLVGPLRPATVSADIKALVAALDSSPAELLLRPRIVQDMWEKWVFLATLAGITCLMRADIGTILKTRTGESLILKLLDECRAIAAAEGVELDRAVIDSYRDQLIDKTSSSTASMLRDIKAHAPIEADHILGDLFLRGNKSAVSCPLLATCFAHLQSYELMREAVG